jgi:hypothetical protein
VKVQSGLLSCCTYLQLREEAQSPHFRNAANTTASSIAFKTNGTLLCVQILNKLLNFLSIGEQQPFTSEMLRDVLGYNGSYTLNISDADQQAVHMLRTALSKQVNDLESMLTGLNMNEFFPGLANEI